jgi:hypothetical protein
MAWADALGGMTASIALAEGQRTATVESKTNFFAAIPKGDTAHPVCVPLHTGRTTIVLQTNITRSDGKLAAIVTQTQIVLPATEQPPDKSRLRASSPRRTSRGSLERFHIGWKQKHFCTVAFSGGNRIPPPIKPGACFS